MPFTSSQIRAAAWVAIALLAFLVLRALGPVLTPFIVAAVLAYALTPLVDRLAASGRGRMPRALAALVVELLFLFALACIFLLVVPVVAKELPLIRQQLPTVLDRLDAAVAPWLNQFGFRVSLDLASMKERLLGYLNANWSTAFPSLWTSLKLGGSVALTVLGNVLLVPVALFYLLLDWKPFVARVLELVPPRARPGVDSFTAECDQVLGQYLRGQLLVMATMAVYYSTGLALFGLDLALPIGVFTGLAMFVPYLGFGFGLLLATFAGLLQFAPGEAFLMIAVVYGSGQVVEGFFITPRLVGERIGLHPLAVIFALLAFAQVLGFVGVLVALPASAVLLVAIRRVRHGYLASRLYQS
ncbi:MAG TPA: AI-2E family transporter [Ramlibacter sp.]|uniref:AI-2E family transporter n=1 Tax=Ramlibacter sp. TaxID=1917967 RepID=UPI002C12DC67|nr:AI-2E family transporter [Ramlibacter sp.]HVZ42773.1 AI-2E family transporter [Ramlibacter sp.]